MIELIGMLILILIVGFFLAPAIVGFGYALLAVYAAIVGVCKGIAQILK